MPTHLYTKNVSIKEQSAADDKYYIRQQSQNDVISIVCPHISNNLY